MWTPFRCARVIYFRVMPKRAFLMEHHSQAGGRQCENQTWMASAMPGTAQGLLLSSTLPEPSAPYFPRPQV